jgi:15-cis-phytoene synthase
MNDNDLDSAYDVCRRINARHGRTYYLATLLLPPAKRPAVHALYGFARWVDDVVDDLGPSTAGQRSHRLAHVRERFLAKDDNHPVLAAVHDTIDRWRIDTRLFDRFFASMEMDLHVRDYATWEDLLAYMDGSAAVVGLQLLPVLETVAGTGEAAAPYARDLGLAFQLTNFIRDVGDDLHRDRVYLPKEDLATFGVTRADLDTGTVDAGVRRLLAFQLTNFIRDVGDDLHRDRVYLPKEDLATFGVTRADLDTGTIDAGVRRLLAFEVARARELYRAAAPGIRLLHPSSRDCVRTAFRLYSGILDAVERNDYRVLDRRARVGVGRRAAVAAPAYLRARRARRG